MNFKNLEIKNFRNFDNISINLANRNVIFGMNDIGKTNFLYAIRFLLDKNIRKDSFAKSDFHKQITSEKIEIMLTIDISDHNDNDDTKNLISIVGTVRRSTNPNEFYIKVVGEYNASEELGEPSMYWGSNKENLIPMTPKGYTYPIDNLFQIVYLNPLIELEDVFYKNKKILIDESKSNATDKDILHKIGVLTKEVNNKIGDLSLIKELQNDLTEEYVQLSEEKVEIKMKSEMAINGVFSDIVPYIKKSSDSIVYPTSGDGRRKILAYSMSNLINRKRFPKKIIIYLIEEPENSLHRSMQIALSHKLFSDNYQYSFISTHSSDILYELDNARLIRIYSQEKIGCKSYLYNIQETFKKDKKRLNKEFCNALFAERILLIEGPSEQVLFEKIMNSINNMYELQGGYILRVNGTYFNTYIEAFKGLGINLIIKTDNDLRSNRFVSDEYELYGLNRCCKIIGSPNLPNIKLTTSSAKTKKEAEINSAKRKQFKLHKLLIEDFEKNNIFLSEIDLENDLYKVIKVPIEKLFGSKKGNAINKMQSSKLYNMVELVDELSDEECEKIYNSKYFRCLKELNNER